MKYIIKRGYLITIFILHQTPHIYVENLSVFLAYYIVLFTVFVQECMPFDIV